MYLMMTNYCLVRGQSVVENVEEGDGVPIPASER
jgi:hypothetical protein